MPSSPEALVNTDDIVLHVSGRSSFNNMLLGMYIEEQTGISCGQIKSYTEFTKLDHVSDRMNLVLMDCKSIDRLTSTENRFIQNLTGKANFLMILFGLNPNAQIELALLNDGVRGILYQDQPISLYPKAVRSVLNGELWYPRAVLEHYFLAKPILPFVPNQMTDSLTARQRDILEHLVAGRTNQEIARKLHLSFHTVKTHVYAIFRKLNVHNRLEATLKMTKR